MSNEEKSWEDNGWIMGGIVAAVFALVGVMMHTIHQSEIRSDEKYAQYEKERLSRPIIDLRDGFIEVQEMNCHVIVGEYSKRQLSKLTEEEKWLVKGSTECGITIQHARIRKDRIRAYSPHFSLFLWRDDKDADDPGAPLHVKEVNVENCEVGVGGTTGEAKWVVIAGKCSLLDRVL